MKVGVHVGLEFVVEGVWSPVLLEEDKRNSFTHPVQTQSALPARVHDTSIVDNGHLDTQANGSKVEVGVRSGTERITNDKETHVLGLGLLQHDVAALLDSITVHDFHLFTVQRLKTFLPDQQDARVSLQIDPRGGFHGLETLEGDVSLVTQSQANERQHRRFYFFSALLTGNVLKTSQGSRRRGLICQTLSLPPHSNHHVAPLISNSQSRSMDNGTLGVLLALGAGLCTTVGGLSVFCVRAYKPKPFAFCMGLSAGVMTYVSLVEIWQEGFSETEHGLELRYPGHPKNAANAYLYTTLLFFGGWIFASLLDRVLHFGLDRCDLLGHSAGFPMEDATHGSVLEDSSCCEDDVENCKEKEQPGCIRRVFFSEKTAEELREIRLAEERFQRDSTKFLRMGLFTAFALGIHNFPEGIATYTGALNDPSFGFGMAIAIGTHNIPEGFSVSVPVYFGTGSRWKAIALSMISGFAEPLGALIMKWTLGSGEVDPLVFGIIFAIVCGIMTNIALKELFVSALRYDPCNEVASKAFLLGMVIMASSLVGFEYV